MRNQISSWEIFFSTDKLSIWIKLHNLYAFLIMDLGLKSFFSIQMQTALIFLMHHENSIRIFSVPANRVAGKICEPTRSLSFVFSFSFLLDAEIVVSVLGDAWMLNKDKIHSNGGFVRAIVFLDCGG